MGYVRLEPKQVPGRLYVNGITFIVTVQLPAENAKIAEVINFLKIGVNTWSSAAPRGARRTSAGGNQV